LQQALTAVEMECMASEMPSRLEIDISDLNIGDSIHVADLLEQESRIVTDPGVAVINVLAPRLTVDEELEREAEEEAAVEEGEVGAEVEEGADAEVAAEEE
jgi:large subunit ribosomal protein L25